MDANKLAAWAGKGGGGGKGQPPPDEQEAHGGEADEQHAAEEEQEDSGEGHGALIAALEAHVDDVVACCDESDVDALADTEPADLSEEDQQILRDGLEALPDELRAALAEHAVGISRADATQIAEHMHSEDLIDDPDRLAGWLYHVGALA